MESWTTGGALDGHKLTGVVIERCVAPLLQLDHNKGCRARAGMSSGQDDVNPLAGEWQLVLDENFDALEACIEDVLSQDRQTSGPGMGFGRRWSTPGAKT